MNILAWVVFGLIVGVAANLADNRPVRGGVLGDIVLGIVGALAGGFLGDLIFGTGVSSFNWSTFIIAAIGTIIVLFAGRRLSGTAS